MLFSLPHKMMWTRSPPLVSQVSSMPLRASSMGQASCAIAAMPIARRPIATYLKSGAQAWLACAEQGAPIGYAMNTAPDIPGMAEGDVELKRIYLLSRYHGSGAASALLDASITAATGANRLLLGVYDQNHRALAFYAKHGFTQIDTRTFNMGGTIYNDVVLALDLSQTRRKSASS